MKRFPARQLKAATQTKFSTGVRNMGAYGRVMASSIILGVVFAFLFLGLGALSFLYLKKGRD